MKLKSSYFFDFGDKNEIYFNLLNDEDFNFKSKNLIIKINLVDKKIKIDILTNSILNFKIASSALIKSLEIINKTLNI